MTLVLRGTASQNAIVQDAIDRCDYPFDRLSQPIPVEWADLSRYASTQVSTHDHATGRAHDDHHDEPAEPVTHFHVEEGGDMAHGVAFRRQVLGLFWLNGRIQIESSLETAPDLAKEVFLAEVAHAADYFDPNFTDDVRIAIWNAVHPDDQHLAPGTDVGRDSGADLGHGHAWFDRGPYSTWVGEEFMGLFCAAFSDIRPTIPFAHVWDPDAAHQVRAALVGPPPAPQSTVFATARGKTFHDAHKGVAADRTFPTREAAIASGLRPCGVCKP